jgi:LAO/AO transport system kinase
MTSCWQRQLAKAITKIENMDPQALAEAASLPLDNSSVQIIGVTGPPGGGKSTLCSQLIEALASKHKVAALLVTLPAPFLAGPFLATESACRLWSQIPMSISVP